MNNRTTIIKVELNKIMSETLSVTVNIPRLIMHMEMSKDHPQCPLVAHLIRSPLPAMFIEVLFMVPCCSFSTPPHSENSFPHPLLIIVDDHQPLILKSLKKQFLIIGLVRN